MNTTATPAIGTVSARCMIARLSITQWTARKLDRTATTKTTTEAGAQADAARVNKYLMAGQDATLKAVAQIATQARTTFYARTAAWADNGDRILSATGWQDLNREMRQAATRFAVAADAFLADYTQARDRARAALGALFSEDDFPTPSQVRRRFGFDFSVDTLPTSTDFRVSLADDDARMIREDIERRTTDRLSGAVREVWQRLADSLQHIADTMRKLETGEQRKLFDSVLGNALEIADLLPGLNFGNDPMMDAIAAEVRASFAGFRTETLRTDPAARTQAATQATAILATVSAHLGHAAPATPQATAQPAAPADPFAALFAPAVRAA